MPRVAVQSGEGKRVPLNMRTTKVMRVRLEAAAAESGRSLAAEVEHRLEQSFASSDVIKLLTGGNQTLIAGVCSALNTRPIDDDKAEEWPKSAAYMAAIAAIVLHSGLSLAELMNDAGRMPMSWAIWALTASGRALDTVNHRVK